MRSHSYGALEVHLRWRKETKGVTAVEEHLLLSLARKAHLFMS